MAPDRLPQQDGENKAMFQNFLELRSLKFQEFCRKFNMRQQAAPLKRVAECE